MKYECAFNSLFLMIIFIATTSVVGDFIAVLLLCLQKVLPSMLHVQKSDIWILRVIGNSCEI